MQGCAPAVSPAPFKSAFPRYLMGKSNQALTATARMAFGSLTEPRTNEYGSSWNAALVLHEDECRQEMDLIQDLCNARGEKDPKFNKKNLNFPFKPSVETNEKGEKVESTDSYLFNFTRAVEKRSRTGEIIKQQPPIIWDSLGRVINPADLPNGVGWGSMVKVQYEYYVYDRGNAGVKFELVGAQIIDLKQEESAPPPVEGGWVVDDGPTDLLSA